MKIVIKRFVAYAIDILIVSIISSLITSNTLINKNYNKYMDTYKEYENISDKYESEKINLQDALEYEAITEQEYDIKLEKLNDSFNEDNVNYNYKLIKLSIVATIVSILVILLYFVVIQYYFNGQTIGKKIMKLRIISKNDKKLGILNYLIRSLILNSVLINTLSIIMIFALSKSNYLIYNKIIYVINYAIETAIIFMMGFTKDHRGLQDYVANTKVIYEGEKYEVQ
ncbi:MAG: RDD family protein [Bacilli bacterium]|nr:RDD family protein [Bacilli bacterium]